LRRVKLLSEEKEVLCRSFCLLIGDILSPKILLVRGVLAIIDWQELLNFSYFSERANDKSNIL